MSRELTESDLVAAVIAERERCAKVAEQMADKFSCTNHLTVAWAAAATLVSRKIREGADGR